MNEKLIQEVEKRVKKELEGIVNPDMFGYIHAFESRKKEILKEEYGIEFETTREKNSSCNID